MIPRWKTSCPDPVGRSPTSPWPTIKHSWLGPNPRISDSLGPGRAQEFVSPSSQVVLLWRPHCETQWSRKRRGRGETDCFHWPLSRRSSLPVSRPCHMWLPGDGFSQVYMLRMGTYLLEHNYRHIDRDWNLAPRALGDSWAGCAPHKARGDRSQGGGYGASPRCQA